MPTPRDGDQRQEKQAETGLVDEHAGETDVPIPRAVEHPVKPAEEPAYRPPVALARLQNQRAERGAQGERVEGREDHRNGDGDGELLVELAGDPRNERRRDKHRREDQGNGDHRPRNLLHRQDRGIPRRHSLFNMVLHRFHHHNGVVHHQADGQDQPEQRERIDGEAQQRKDDERPNQGNRHRQQGNQRGAPALEEDVDHENDQQQGLKQRQQDFMNPGRDRLGGVHTDFALEVLGQPPRQFVQLRAHSLRGGNRVGTGQLVDADGRRRACP